MILGGEDMYCRKCGKEITDESKYCQFVEHYKKQMRQPEQTQ